MSKNSGSVPYQDALNRPKMKKPGPKELRSIEVEKATGGGHVVTHRFKQDNSGHYHDSEDHVFGTTEGKHLIEHLSSHLGIKGSKEAESK